MGTYSTELSFHEIATVGTIGAVLAGLDITMFIEFTPHDDSTWVGRLSYQCI